jgi:cytochrome c
VKQYGLGKAAPELLRRAAAFSNPTYRSSTMKNKTFHLLAGSVFAAMIAHVPAHAAVDEDAALALAKKEDCTKCHAVDKTKKGPSYKKIAAKYKEKKMTEKDAIKQMQDGKKVKLEDGTEEDHKIIETKDPKALSNLAQWILSR